MLGAFLTLLLTVGQIAAAATLVDDSGASHLIPEVGQPLLVIYEDQDGGKQNQGMKALIAAYHDPVANRAKLTVWPIADLSRWNWWPAKGKALAEVKKSAQKNNTRILIDWTGALQKAWGLQKKKNSIVLVVGGKVRYASEGECTAAQSAALEAELRSLGLSK